MGICTARCVTLYPFLTTAGNSVPSWLAQPGPVYVRKHARKSKYDPVVETAELIEANPEYAFIRLQNGHETTASLRDLAPCGAHEVVDDSGSSTSESLAVDVTPEPEHEATAEPPVGNEGGVHEGVQNDAPALGRGGRVRRPPDWFHDSKHSTGR